MLTIHDKDPSRDTEEFDRFVKACPADLREGVIMQNGRRIHCARLFDRLAIDWLGHENAAYQKISVAVALRALRNSDGCKITANPEEIAKRQAIKVGDLSNALEKATARDVQQQAVSIIEIGDI